MATVLQSSPESTGAPIASVLDMLLSGGPVMIPLALCSAIALTYAIERAVRLRASALGVASLERELLPALATGGIARGLDVVERAATPAARVLRVALSHWNAPYLEREKQTEEAGLREVRTLSANLKPLVYIAMLAPLLGFLGTVYGMIVAFSTVASSASLGRPEMLAAGISQALVTTAAGLTIAVPAQVLYYVLKSRVERFSRELEDLHARASDTLRRGIVVAPPAPKPEATQPPETVAAQPA
ncbi:MAG: MotA/TolQ/ExbB proton channel family protein [Planctomycetota bacterium]|nr:MotA/TolQ/ExbB proton channel family protein [Planctomycetota bacterium]